VAIEAEMSGFDDAGMHRADRDFVDLLAGYGKEIGLAARGAARRKADGLQPGMTHRLDAELLENFALKIMRR
jgi:hypothetical protein